MVGYRKSSKHHDNTAAYRNKRYDIEETKRNIPREREKKQEDHQREEMTYLEQQAHTENKAEAAETYDNKERKG